MNRKPDFREILREGLILTGAVAIIAAAVAVVRKVRRRSGTKPALFKRKTDTKPDDKSDHT